MLEDVPGVSLDVLGNSSGELFHRAILPAAVAFFAACDQVAWAVATALAVRDAVVHAKLNPIFQASTAPGAAKSAPEVDG